MKELEYSGESFAGATVSSLLTTSTKHPRTLFALCAAVVLATAATYGNMHVNDVNLKPAARALSDVHEPLLTSCILNDNSGKSCENYIDSSLIDSLGNKCNRFEAIFTAKACTNFNRGTCVRDTFWRNALIL
jgi:hypothetical protein